MFFEYNFTSNQDKILKITYQIILDLLFKSFQANQVRPISIYAAVRQFKYLTNSLALVSIHFVRQSLLLSRTKIVKNVSYKVPGHSLAWLMWSACHVKSYLLCVELTNFGIFTKPFPIFFSKQAKLRQANRAETADFRFLTSRFVK